MNTSVERNVRAVKVSVIIPIHNSEKYLRECLKSALNQTLEEIEILCIDTGNTELCLEMIAEFQKTDDRIVYIRDSDSSYGHKVNVGIGASRGDYIAILESDDQMSPKMLESLYSVAREHGVDIVDSDYIKFFSFNGKKFGRVILHYQEPEKYGHVVTREKGLAQNTATNGIWTALYRKNFLLENEIRLNESPGASYQDTSFMFLTSFFAKTVYHLQLPLYHYRVDNTSSSVKNDNKVFDILGECAFLKEELRKRNVQESFAWSLYYTLKYNVFYWNYCRLSERSRAMFLEQYLKELKSDIASGTINRELCDQNLYDRTFLLLDAPEKFRELVAEANRHRPLEAIAEVLERLEGQEVVVFGAGLLGGRVIDILQQNGNRLLCVCDNAAALHGTNVGGYEVHPVEDTTKKFPNAHYLIVSRNYSDEMKAQLLDEKIDEANIEIFT